MEPAEFNEFQEAVLDENFILARKLEQEHGSQWPPLKVVGDRYWNHLGFYCSINGLKFLHYDLGWDLDEDNGDDYGRTMITVFGYLDEIEKVKAMHDMGYRVNTGHRQSPYVDGPWSGPGPLNETMKDVYLQYT